MAFRICAAWRSLASAAELRAKEHGEFQASDKELLLNIDSLKNAIVILGRTHTSFLQGKKMHAETFVEAQRAVKPSAAPHAILTLLKAGERVVYTFLHKFY